MGVCLGLVFDKELPEAEEFSELTDGKCLAGAIDVLDDICAARGLTPFSTFAPDLESPPEGWSEGDGPVDESTFDCADALRIIPELVNALQTEK